ncbi:hypothetical protein OF83DRAFT_1177190 [Amylostereum chailletii]|nr:hypothetical protein OF83DRAFT_1177190 [Amylostereum chailletii]
MRYLQIELSAVAPLQPLSTRMKTSLTTTTGEYRLPNAWIALFSRDSSLICIVLTVPPPAAVLRVEGPGAHDARSTSFGPARIAIQTASPRPNYSFVRSTDPMGLTEAKQTTRQPGVTSALPLSHTTHTPPHTLLPTPHPHTTIMLSFSQKFSVRTFVLAVAGEKKTTGGRKVVGNERRGGQWMGGVVPRDAITASVQPPPRLLRPTGCMFDGMRCNICPHHAAGSRTW